MLFLNLGGNLLKKILAFISMSENSVDNVFQLFLEYSSNKNLLFGSNCFMSLVYSWFHFDKQY